MRKRFVASLSAMVVALLAPAILLSATALAAPCQPGSSLLGLPTWYKYLDGQLVMEEATGVQICQPALNGANDIWKIVAAALEILLRVGSLIAIGFVVYGGVTYILSQGAPDKTKQALQTIINALVGLVISIIAAALVGFIAGRF
jgi:hypothetical protein